MRRCLTIRSPSQFFSAIPLRWRTVAPAWTFGFGDERNPFCKSSLGYWYIADLRADAKTGNDAIANASLPDTALSINVVFSTANGRALGLDTPPKMCACGSLNDGCPYDGIITLNSDVADVPFTFTRPPSPDQYDAQRVTEHEMDEVLGLRLIFGFSSRSRFVAAGSVQLVILHDEKPSTSGLRFLSIDSGSTRIVTSIKSWAVILGIGRAHHQRTSKFRTRSLTWGKSPTSALFRRRGLISTSSAMTCRA